MRPVLLRPFNWFVGVFDGADEASTVWIAICFLALLLPPAFAVLRRIRYSRGLFFGSIAVCLVLCRFPTLLESEFNPDEGQFLASAHKLFYDPNFFHSVDTGTSGPLNIYPLMLPEILGFSPDFASSRVIVLLIVLLSVFLLYRSIALVATEELARFGILPLVAAFAVFKNTELIHYSSEHVPLLLISTALYFSVRVLRSPSEASLPLFVLGLLVSSAFFAKIQSVPILAAEASVAIACVYATGHAGKVWRPALLFIAGGLPLPIMNTILCVSSGVWSDFWTSYIRANFSYAATHSSFVQNLQGFMVFLLGTNEILFFLFVILAMGVAYLADRMRQQVTSEQSTFVQLAAVATVIAVAILLPPLDRLTIYAFLGLLAIGFLPAYLIFMYRRGSLGDDPVRWFGILAGASSAAALFSVYAAHHTFIHYLLLLFVPLCACAAWMLIREAAPPVRTPFLALLTVLVVTYQSYLWSFQDEQVFRNVATTIRPPEGDYIRSLVTPAARIFVWGWTVRPYLASGHVPSTRDTNVSNCFRAYNLMTSPPEITLTRASQEISAYYERRILHDLRAKPPELFIDAVGPTSWFLNDRKYYGFEQFPEIADFVKTNYVFLSDSFDQRYYLRRDRVSVK